MLCGQLERHFRGRTIFYMTCPGSALWKPCKSRLFSCLIVHARPPFPFTFRFLPPVDAGGTVGAVFRPVGLWSEHAAADLTAFQVLSPENLCFQRPVLGQDRPAEPLTADRERNGLGASMAVPVVKSDTVPALAVAALPADKAVCLFPLRRRHAVEGTVRSAFQGRQSLVQIFYHAFLRFLAAVLPEKASCPIPAACSGVGTLPILRDILSRSWIVAVLPMPDIPFRTVIRFSRCCSPMN